MHQILTYGLYGEETGAVAQDWLHWETIPARAGLHDYSIAPHRHEQFLQILLLTAGSAEAQLDGAAFSLASPAVVVVPPLTVHGYRFSPNVDGVVLTLMDADVRELDLGFSGAAVLIGGTDVVLDAAQRLISEADRPGARHEPAMRAHLTLLLVALHRSRLDRAGRGDDAGSRTRLHAARFLYAVDQLFRHTRRVADYATAVGISAAHLNRVSREVLGASALKVIERRIALEARRQLLFSTLPIKQIGMELGYDDPAYFTRTMTRALGSSPAAFRRSGGGRLR